MVQTQDVLDEVVTFFNVKIDKSAPDRHGMRDNSNYFGVAISR